MEMQLKQETEKNARLEQQVTILNAGDRELREQISNLKGDLRGTTQAISRTEGWQQTYFLIGTVIVALIAAIRAVRDVRDEHRTTVQFKQESALLRDRQKISENEVQVSSNMLSKTEEMLKSQLTNIAGLGNVINVVEQAFGLLVRREEEVKEILEELEKIRRRSKVQDDDFQQKYEEVCEWRAETKDIKARDWPSLAPQRVIAAQKARFAFDSLPSYFLEEKRKTERYGFAHLLQLLGTSALYANEIKEAEQKLHESDNLFADCQVSEYDFPRSYAKHFRALLEKNWRIEGAAEGSNFSLARDLLEAAWNIQHRPAGNFIIPVTLAEVCSYLPSKRDEAHKFLDVIIDHAGCKQGKFKDDNQRDLYQRAYIIKANIAYLEEDFAQAQELFERAVHVNDRNPYAVLSLAHSKRKPKAPSSEWQRGIDLLKESKALDRSEPSSRGTALAWAIIAYRSVQRDTERRFELGRLEALVAQMKNPIAHRLPLVFCPVRKVMVSFQDLVAGVKG